MPLSTPRINAYAASSSSAREAARHPKILSTGRDPVRMAQPRLGLRPERHPAALPKWRIITADSSEAERLRARHQLPAGHHSRRRWTDNGIPIDTPKDKEPGNHGRRPTQLALRQRHLIGIELG